MPKNPKKNEDQETVDSSSETDGVLDLSDYDSADKNAASSEKSQNSNSEDKDPPSSGPSIEDYEKLKNSYLYLRADFENYKKTAIKERSDLIKYGNERLVVRILDVMDAFDRALDIEVNPQNLESYIEGIKLTREELTKALSQFGLKEIDCDNKDFDPTLHEALSSEETDQVPPGKITQVFKKAYKLHDRLIRPAQVVVSKEPSSDKE